jgi:hypothetical protein
MASKTKEIHTILPCNSVAVVYFKCRLSIKKSPEKGLKFLRGISIQPFVLRALNNTMNTAA